MGRWVTIFGTILPPRASTPPGSFILDVDPVLGDAKEFNLAGQIVFAGRQCEIGEAQVRGQRDIVRMPEHIAQLKSELAGNVRKRRKR